MVVLRTYGVEEQQRNTVGRELIQKVVGVSLVHNSENECKVALRDGDLMEVDDEAAVVDRVAWNIEVEEEADMVDVVGQIEGAGAAAAGWEVLDIADGLELLESEQEVESKGLAEGQKEPGSEDIGSDAELEEADSAVEELEEEQQERKLEVVAAEKSQMEEVVGEIVEEPNPYVQRSELLMVGLLSTPEAFRAAVLLPLYLAYP